MTKVDPEIDYSDDHARSAPRQGSLMQRGNLRFRQRLVELVLECSRRFDPFQTRQFAKHRNIPDWKIAADHRFRACVLVEPRRFERGLELIGILLELEEHIRALPSPRRVVEFCHTRPRALATGPPGFRAIVEIFQTWIELRLCHFMPPTLEVTRLLIIRSAQPHTRPSVVL